MDKLTAATGIADQKTVFKKHQIDKPSLQSGFRETQVYSGKAGDQQLADSMLSELSLSRREAKLVSLTDTDYEQTDYYQEQAKKTIAKFYQTAGAVPVAPTFVDVECKMEDGFPQLQNLRTTSDGLKMLDLVNAILELFVVTRKIKGQNTKNLILHCSDIDRFASYPFEFDDSTSRSLFVTRLSQIVHKIIGSRYVKLYQDITDFGCWRYTRWMRILSDSSFGYCLELCQFIVKLLSCCMINNIDVKLSQMVYLDANLAISEIKNPYVFLYLKPKQIKRWLISLEQAKIVIPDIMFIDDVLRPESVFNIFNNFFWSQNKGKYIDGDDETLSIEMLERYELDYFIPSTICDILFTPYSSKQSTKESEEKPISLDKKDLFNKDDVRFGEELEYWICDSDRLSSTGPGISDYDAKSRLRRWKIKTVRLLGKMNVKFELPDIDYDKLKLHYNIGSMQFKVFRDDDVIEIITTPYKMHEKFTLEINNETVRWDFYKMSDVFIHPIAKESDFKGCSGHKQIDLIPAFNGNAELLFRFIIDIEGATWQPRAFGREASINHFPYAVKDVMKYKRLCSMVSGVNRYLVNGNGLPRLGDFNNILKLKEFLEAFNMNQKYSPCALHHLQEARHTIDINIKPTSTTEWRVPNCPVSGENSLLLNDSLITRIEYLMDCQERRELLSYNPVHPDFYRHGRDKEVVEAFAQHVHEMGRKPSEFILLLQIEIPEECIHLFRSTS